MLLGEEFRAEGQGVGDGLEFGFLRPCVRHAHTPDVPTYGLEFDMPYGLEFGFLRPRVRHAHAYTDI